MMDEPMVPMKQVLAQMEAIHQEEIRRPRKRNEIPMSEPLLLSQATVQEIQLELIRRTNFNAFEGEKIHASLLKHRDLWLAVILDRPGLGGDCFDLIKLRDLPSNTWNASTLFILTKTHEQAEELVQFMSEEGWDADESEVSKNRKEISKALGITGGAYGLIRVWWD
jgi:hypothetical protein